MGYGVCFVISWKSDVYHKLTSLPVTTRLLHSHNLAATGLSLGYETWPSIGWHWVFVIGWSKYRLSRVSCIVGSRDKWEFPDSGDSPFARLCKGTVKQSRLMCNCEIHDKTCRQFARCCFCCGYIVTGFTHIHQDYFSGITVLIRSIAPVDQSHKSHNAREKYPTMHHFVTEICTFPLQISAL